MNMKIDGTELHPLRVIGASLLMWTLVTVTCALLICCAVGASAFALFNLPAALLRKGRG